MYRWTLMDGPIKILVHHFLPNGDDPDPHDHPRSFVTFILAGDYIDESVEDGVLHYEHMERGALRLRRAKHMHRTLVGERGCWTIVVMGPISRRWGFLWDGRWWPWKKYLDERGDVATRCPE